MKWRNSGEREEAKAEAVIKDEQVASLHMIWRHSQTNPRIADWINTVKWMRRIRPDWKGIEELAFRLGWEDSFQVTEAVAVAATEAAAAVVPPVGAAAKRAQKRKEDMLGGGGKEKRSKQNPFEPALVSTPVTTLPATQGTSQRVVAAEKQVPAGRESENEVEERCEAVAAAFDSPFDDAVTRSPTVAPSSVGVGGMPELSDMEESVATVVTVLCTGWHNWEDYECPGYKPLKSVKSCWKCGVGFYLDGPYRIRLSTPVHYCSDCHIVVCVNCRRDMLVTDSPNKENRRRRRKV